MSHACRFLLESNRWKLTLDVVGISHDRNYKSCCWCWITYSRILGWSCSFNIALLVPRNISPWTKQTLLDVKKAIPKKKSNRIMQTLEFAMMVTLTTAVTDVSYGCYCVSVLTVRQIFDMSKAQSSKLCCRLARTDYRQNVRLLYDFVRIKDLGSREHRSSRISHAVLCNWETSTLSYNPTWPYIASFRLLAIKILLRKNGVD